MSAGFVEGVADAVFGDEAVEDVEDGVAVGGVEGGELADALGDGGIGGGEGLSGGAVDEEVVAGDVEGFGEADEGVQAGGDAAVLIVPLPQGQRQTPVVPLPACAVGAGAGVLQVGGTVYQCPDCQSRLLGEQRCEDCATCMARLGPGGICPCCDEPITFDELIAGQ
jgi:hypothetical protein